MQTAGNQVRQAKGMKVSFDIRDIKLNNSNNSQGTIGSINGTVTWSSDGIKQSIQNAVPVLGAFVSGGVTTNPGDGTIQMKGVLDSATVKPQIVNNGLSLQVVDVSALGAKMSTATAQKYLDDLMAKATQNYPLGLHADSIKVTDSGVEATFSSSNATIPAGGSSRSLPGQPLAEAVQHSAGARQPQPGGARIEHRHSSVGRANAAAGFDSQPPADGVGHQLHGGHRRAAGGMKTRGGLHEIRAGVFGGTADGGQGAFAGKRQQGSRLDDHLEHGAGHCGAYRRDVRPHGVDVAGDCRPDVDDHVDLAGAGCDGLRGFSRLQLR